MGFIWDKNATHLQLIAAVKLMEYEKSRSFSREEIDAYKEGLAAIPVFLAECQEEYEKMLDN
jgi:hypothetical protein